jgi:hypothetical protein
VDEHASDLAGPFTTVESARRIPTLPLQSVAGPERLTRASILGTAGGLAAYATIPAATITSRAGNADELMAASFGLAVALFSSIGRAPTGCADEDKAEDIFETGKGAAGGAAFGMSAAALTSAPLLSLLDGGILTGSVLLAAIGTQWFRRSRKKKFCPGLRGIRHQGNCSQRVCRQCYSLFVPDESLKTLDCKLKRNLDSYEIASVLHFQGLSYLDVERLVEDHILDWAPTRSPGGNLYVNCSRFSDWVDNNSGELAKYIGLAKFESRQEADHVLKKKQL